MHKNKEAIVWKDDLWTKMYLFLEGTIKFILQKYYKICS